MLSSYIEKIDEKLSTIDKLFKEATTVSNISDFRSHCSETTSQSTLPVENFKNKFTLGPSNERIINSIPKLDTNPARSFNEYTENILPNDLRSSICQFLQEYPAFTDRNSHKIAYFGHDFNKRKNVMPKPILEAINLIHEKYSTTDINSVHVIKFSGKSSHLNQQSDFSPYLSPESNIYNIFLGDSSTIKFIDKCNIEESVLNVCDNSIYTNSAKSQHYWSYGVDRPASS